MKTNKISKRRIYKHPLMHFNFPDKIFGFKYDNETKRVKMFSSNF
jgi:hypothetical protein